MLAGCLHGAADLDLPQQLVMARQSGFRHFSSGCELSNLNGLGAATGTGILS